MTGGTQLAKVGGKSLCSEGWTSVKALRKRQLWVRGEAGRGARRASRDRGEPAQTHVSLDVMKTLAFPCVRSHWGVVRCDFEIAHRLLWEYRVTARHE